MSHKFNDFLAVLSRNNSYVIPANRVAAKGNSSASDSALITFFDRFGYRNQSLTHSASGRIFTVLKIDGRTVVALNTDPYAPNSSNYFYIKPSVLSYIMSFVDAEATIALFDTSFYGGEFNIRLMNHLQLTSFVNRCRKSYYTDQFLYFKYNKVVFAHIAANTGLKAEVAASDIKTNPIKADAPVPESVKVLNECAELQLKKSNDYQNPNSKVKQAMHYRRGVDTIYDIMHGKMLRIQSLLEAKTDNPNFESLEDSFKDLINYGSFAVSYLRGKMDGQA